MARTSLVGVLGTLCTYFGVPVDKRRGSCPTVARIFSTIAMAVDAADLVLDAIFVADLFRDGNPGWGALMATAVSAAHALDWLYEPVVQSALVSHGYGYTYLYYFGTSECIVFLVEDAATIYMFSRIPGAFDGSLSDYLNLTITLLSALIVSVFVLVGGMRLIMRGQAASWIPHLAITNLAHGTAKRCGLPFGRVMAVLISLKCILVAAVVGFFAYLTFGYALRGKVVDGPLSALSTSVLVIGVVLGLLLSLRSSIDIVEMRMDGGTGEEEEDRYDEGRSLSVDIPPAEGSGVVAWHEG